MKLLLFANLGSIHTFKIVSAIHDCWPESRIHIISFGREFDFNYSNFKKGVSFEIIGSTLIKSKGNNFSYLLHIPAIFIRVLSFRPDFIISIYLTSYGFLASLFKFRSKLIHIVIGSDGMIAPFVSPIHWFVTWFALLRANLIMAVSYTLKSKLTVFPFIHNKKFFLSQYGVDNSLLQKQIAFRRSFISIRAIIPNSNIDFVIKLFVESNCSEDLIIVGFNESIYHRWLYSLSEKSANIRWLRSMEHGLLLDLVLTSKFFFSLTHSDGASLSLMEAMALGSIPIVSSIPANQEWITDGVNGLLIDLNNFDSSIKKFKDFISRDEVFFDCIREINKSIIIRRGLIKCNVPLLLSKIVDL